DNSADITTAHFRGIQSEIPPTMIRLIPPTSASTVAETVATTPLIPNSPAKETIFAVNSSPAVLTSVNVTSRCQNCHVRTISCGVYARSISEDSVGPLLGSPPSVVTVSSSQFVGGSRRTTAP